MPKYYRKQILTHWSFPEVGHKQKTEREKKRRKKLLLFRLFGFGPIFSLTIGHFEIYLSKRTTEIFYFRLTTIFKILKYMLGCKNTFEKLRNSGS